MIQVARRGLQSLLTRVGEHLEPHHVRQLNAVVNYLEVGRWMRSRGFVDFPRYRTRQELHAAAAADIAREIVLYLEFGVWEGASLRLWSALLENPSSFLHGFDSFEGLPEDWDGFRRKGTFALNGRLPEFTDTRVVLHEGWFSDTLPGFESPRHERLVVHLDADLYSSTDFVLRTIERLIIPGAVLIFDEFCDRFHELRAFHEYLERTNAAFRAIGATENLEQVAFCRTG
jgi:hypothetical protein